MEECERKLREVQTPEYVYFWVQKYQLYVIEKNATIPVIDVEVLNSSYQHISWAWIGSGKVFTWKVRAYVKKYVYPQNITYSWSTWSETRSFTVEPVNTDSP